MARKKTKGVDHLTNRMSKVRLVDKLNVQASITTLASPSSISISTSTPLPPFRFFDLPSELRLRIYESLLVFPHTIDLDPTNHDTIAPALCLLLVSQAMHTEAANVFFSCNTFRVFPIHGCYINRKYPLLAWLPRRHRAHMTRLELRLGPGFTRPPKGWVVGSRLGLAAATKVYKLKVFVEFDPSSNEVFEGFLMANDSYTEYCIALLRALLVQVSSVREVEFDAYPSVPRSSPLLKGLVNETKLNQKRIAWGPERGWETTVELVR